MDKLLTYRGIMGGVSAPGGAGGQGGPLRGHPQQGGGRVGAAHPGGEEEGTAGSAVEVRRHCLHHRRSCATFNRYNFKIQPFSS